MPTLSQGEVSYSRVMDGSVSINQPFNGGKLLIQRAFIGAALAVSLLATSGAASASTVWSQKDDFVRIEPGEGAKPAPGGNRLPTITPDAVKAIFAAIKVTGDGGSTSFVDEDQAALIAEPVAHALQSAGPGEDVVFNVHYVSFMSIVGPPKTSAGRIFLDGDAVGVIVGQVQQSYTSGFVNLDQAKIKTGSRLAAQSSWRVQPNGFMQYAVADRGDWVRISPTLWLGNYAVAPAAPAPVMPVAAPAPVYAPAPAPVVAAPPAPPAPPPGIEERFAMLKRLHDAGQITDAEYEKSKATLLQGLTALPH
jgi:hypothetical protein